MIPLTVLKIRNADDRNRGRGRIGPASHEIKGLFIGRKRSARFIKIGRDYSGRENFWREFLLLIVSAPTGRGDDGSCNQIND